MKRTMTITLEAHPRDVAIALAAVARTIRAEDTHGPGLTAGRWLTLTKTGPRAWNASVKVVK